MNPREFFEMVALMRKHQKQCSRSNGRDRQAMLMAKDAERRIDEEIARVRVVMKEQMQPKLDFS